MRKDRQPFGLFLRSLGCGTRVYYYSTYDTEGRRKQFSTGAKEKKEAMRMMQFVRFQHTKDGLWFCGIEPRYDVMSLVAGHFQKRFADQKWLLYDLKRNYGILYDKTKVEEVVISSKEFSSITGQVNENVLQEGEEFYQKLWKSYFKNISIQERKNLKLQRQHMPRRFWKYLPEMFILN